MRDFLQNEEGQGMIEYALIIALVSVVAIVVLTNIGKSIVNKFTEVDDALNPPTTP